MIGFLNVYKPQGLTSFAVIRKIKREVKPLKIGHLGTLDPMAEGILPVAIGHGTRLIEYITDKSKTYYATMILGGTSDTQDQWGTITPVPCPSSFTQEEILQVWARFRGEIHQIPPMYSAVHHDGQRLYELARKGIVVERQARKAFISQLDFVSLSTLESGRQEVAFRVKCSEGTYIRTLCHDIGQALGTGAYMTSLLREKWGAFSLENAISLDTAMQEWTEHLIDPLEILHDFPTWELSEDELFQKVSVGNSFPLPSDFPDAAQVLLITKDRTIAAVAGRHLSEDGVWEVRPYKVFK